MHRYLNQLLTAVAAAATLVGVSVTPAQAAPAAVNMTFQVRPGPATVGAPLTLSGRVWAGATGNAGRVHLYFQRNGTTTWAAGGHVTADNGGYFTKRTTARVSGTWKAVFQGTVARRATLRTATSKVVRAVPDRIASYASDQVMWTGPTIRIPTAQYRAVITYACTDLDNENLGLVFGFGPEHFLVNQYDYIESPKASGTITMNGRNGLRTGYFQAYSISDCTWSAQIFAGTRAVMV